MPLESWIFLIVSWGIIIYLTAYSFIKVLANTKRDKKINHHRPKTMNLKFLKNEPLKSIIEGIIWLVVPILIIYAVLFLL